MAGAFFPQPTKQCAHSLSVLAECQVVRRMIWEANYAKVYKEVTSARVDASSKAILRLSSNMQEGMQLVG
jgi:hypothetical protein